MFTPNKTQNVSIIPESSQLSLTSQTLCLLNREEIPSDSYHRLFSWNKGHKYSFVYDSFAQHNVFWNLSLWLGISVAHSFLFCSSVLLYEYIIICWKIILLMDILYFLLWIFLCKSFCGHMILLFLGIWLAGS